MIHPPHDKDLLLAAILEALGSGQVKMGPVGKARRWSLAAEPRAILFDDAGRTFRVSTYGSVEETDGSVASFTQASRTLEREVKAALDRLRYADERIAS